MRETQIGDDPRHASIIPPRHRSAAARAVPISRWRKSNRGSPRSIARIGNHDWRISALRDLLRERLDPSPIEPRTVAATTAVDLDPVELLELAVALAVRTLDRVPSQRRDTTCRERSTEMDSFRGDGRVHSAASVAASSIIRFVVHGAHSVTRLGKLLADQHRIPSDEAKAWLDVTSPE